MPHTHSPDVREVRLFKNRRNQALRIPIDFAFDADRVRIHREGQRLVIEPIHDNGLVALLNRWQPLAEDVPVIEDHAPMSEDIF